MHLHGTLAPGPDDAWLAAAARSVPPDTDHTLDVRPGQPLDRRPRHGSSGSTGIANVALAVSAPPSQPTDTGRVTVTSTQPPEVVTAT